MLTSLWTSVVVAVSYLLSLVLPGPGEVVAGVVALGALVVWTVRLLRRPGRVAGRRAEADRHAAATVRPV